MTDTTWTSAPAGILRRGGADVRAYPGVVVCPAGVRMRPLAGAFAVPSRNQSTPLGFHTASRPQS